MVFILLYKSTLKDIFLKFLNGWLKFIIIPCLTDFDIKHLLAICNCMSHITDWRNGILNEIEIANIGFKIKFYYF